jgi:transcriptional antiterminator RfaH
LQVDQTKMTLQWYALRSKPNREEALWREATARGFQVYYPRTRVQPVNPRSRKIKAYFPGYMFVQAQIDAVGFSAFAWMPYSSGLVFCGSEPSPVPDALVNAIRRHLDDVNAAGGELFDGLKQGDGVSIQDGPFAGYEAIFDSRLPGNQRVRVLLQLLSKQRLPLELPSGQIRRTNHR